VIRSVTGRSSQLESGGSTLLDDYSCPGAFVNEVVFDFDVGWKLGGGCLEVSQVGLGELKDVSG